MLKLDQKVKIVVPTKEGNVIFKGFFVSAVKEYTSKVIEVREGKKPFLDLYFDLQGKVKLSQDYTLDCYIVPDSEKVEGKILKDIHLYLKKHYQEFLKRKQDESKKRARDRAIRNGEAVEEEALEES